MFQDFSSPSKKISGDERLSLLRDQMKSLELDALIIPHGDEQRNEYLPSCNERLAWTTGFTGSAGAAIITENLAIIFVDGRYTLQAAEQTDPSYFQVESLVDNPPHKWLGSHSHENWRVGIDPWLHGQSEVEQLNKALEKHNGKLKLLEANLVDIAWAERPSQPMGKVEIHPIEYAGVTTREKLEQLNESLRDAGAEICVISDATSVSWLFNIRGNDVTHTPLVLAHAILRTGKRPILFIDERKLDIETTAYLNQVADLMSPSSMSDQIRSLSQNTRVMLDPSQTPFAIEEIVRSSGGTIVPHRDPIVMPKAIKNSTEIEGCKAAHIRDGAAMATFLCWLDGQDYQTLDEITAAKKLEAIRSEMTGNLALKDISFDTISGSGPNGAIVHYRVNESTNRAFSNNELYLIDSGGQYMDGTTDITRTIAIGEPGEEESSAFTLVLKGHIAIATARFPQGTRGMDLDPLARMPLWQEGKDYAHGTGHGVGSYLAVHEGPQNISKRGVQELMSGMILSNEPGHYKAGHYGIRIENLILVNHAPKTHDDELAMLQFENLTWAPIDYRLIRIEMLSDFELGWVNNYHRKVYEILHSKVNEKVKIWLAAATRPLKNK